MKGMRNIAPFGLRMPDEIREAVAERAKKNGRSMNSEIIDILGNSLFSTSIGQDAVDYILSMTSQNEITQLPDDERDQLTSLLLQIAEKLTDKIEKESGSLKQVLGLIATATNKKPT